MKRKDYQKPTMIKLKNSRIEKFKILSLAALLMAGAAFAACSSSNDSIIDEHPVNPAQKTYTLTVNATKGSDAQTRALSLDNNTLNVKWAATDEVSVFPAAWSRTALGTLTAAASDNGSTSLTGDLTTLPAVTDNLNLLFPRATWDYTGQTGDASTVGLLTDADFFFGPAITSIVFYLK